MIPSMTKLVLLYYILGMFAYVYAFPGIHDQRQEGDLNIRADFSNISFLVAPTKEMLKDGTFLLELFGSLFVPAKAMQQIRESTKKNYLNSDNDISKDAVVDNKINLSSRRIKFSDVRLKSKNMNEKDRDDEVLDNIAENPVSEPLEKVEEVKVKEEVRVTNLPTEETTEKLVTNGNTTEKQDYKLIQQGIEECGPDGVRDQTGKCVFSKTT